MEQITLIKRNGSRVNLFSTEPLCAVTQAVQDITLMGDDTVTLTVKSTALIDFEIGDKIIIGGHEYFLRTIPSREVVNEDLFSYELKLYGVIYELIKCQYRDADINGVSKRSTFDLTYSIADFIKVIINNVNRDYPGLWIFDEVNCPDTEPLNISFSKQNCLQVLQNVCKEFKYDFVIDQMDGTRTIRIGKFGNVIAPPAGNNHFEYGKGKGLFNLREKKIDDKSVITRLWVEGGMKNIKSDYRDFSDRLQLPYPARNNSRQHILSDGTIIEPNTQSIGIDNDSERYIEDTVLRDDLGSIEDTEYYDEIYPKRTGIITSLGDDIYSFVDDQMDFDLKAKDSSGNTVHLVDGVSAKITFITGKLAGMQFELADYAHETNTFKIIRHTDDRGLSFPSEKNTAFRFSKDDKYEITDINLPESYILNAEEDLWFAGYDSFLKRKQPMAKYELVFDRLYFLNSMPHDSNVMLFKPGDYVPIKDSRFGIEKNIRIQNVKRNVLREHDYAVTLSDTTAISVYNRAILDSIEHNTIINRNGLRDVSKARLNWKTTAELRNMVFDTDGYFDGGNIRPNSIETNMLSIGAKSQQFVLENTVFNPNYLGDRNIVEIQGGTLVHYTIDENGLKEWIMGDGEVELLNDGAFYIYAKCQKIGNYGGIIFTSEQITVEQDSQNYHFLIGIANSVQDGVRSLSLMYGFTFINGRYINTGRIQSSGGTGSFFDLDYNQFRIGDANKGLSWNIDNNGQLILRGTMVQTSSGYADVIGVFRGFFSYGIKYVRGEEVSFGGSIYRCIVDLPTTGIAPNNSTYWIQTVSKGDTGSSAKFVKITANGGAFKYDSADLTGTPAPTTITLQAITQNIVAGTIQWQYWNAAQWVNIATGESLVVSHNSSYWFQAKTRTIRVVIDGSYTDQITIVKLGDGNKGDKGEPGSSPAMVYRGKFEYYDTYFGNSNRRDVVFNESDELYYIANINAGTFTEESPEALSNWELFGAQFESVATKLLLAENANIANFIFANQVLESQQSTNNIANIILNGLTGYASFGAGKNFFNPNGSGVLANGNIVYDENGNIVITGKFESAKNGDRIIINPATQSIQMYDSNNRRVANLSFDKGDGSTGRLDLNRYNAAGTIVGSTTIFGGRLIIDADYIGAPLIDISYFENKLNFRMDITKLPTSASQAYYGQIYRNGESLMIKTT